MKLTVVVAIPRDARRIDHRPVRHVPEKAVGVILEIGRFHEGRPEPQTIGIRARAVAFLNRVAAAK
jgi:hypothetical protein